MSIFDNPLTNYLIQKRVSCLNLHHHQRPARGRKMEKGKYEDLNISSIIAEMLQK